MAAVAGPATPQRPLPGAYMATPAPPTIFAQNAASLRQNPQPQPSDQASGAVSSSSNVSPVEMAARKVNESLAEEEQFPSFEEYVKQGPSTNYDETSSNPAWAPFQKLKQHDLPTRLLDQANNSSTGMMMGIFPALGHAWAALDNSLYLWDYTLPNPELIGWEDSAYPIVDINIVPPKPGVFIKDIAHLIVVTTSTDMTLLGVAATTGPGGAKSIALYNTRMQITIRGLSIDHVVSSKDGRIFMVGDLTEDIYEFQYQSDEGWFRGRTARICLTKTQFAFVQDNMKAVGHFLGPNKKKVRVRQMVVDDTRNLLYALTNDGVIRFYAIQPAHLQLARDITLRLLLQTTSTQLNRQTDILHGQNVAISSLSVLPATETPRNSLMVTLNTGVRLYLSVTRGFGYEASAQYPPTTIQVLCIRFPPRDPSATTTGASPSQQMSVYASNDNQIDISSHLLLNTVKGHRSPPGYFMAFRYDDSNTIHGECKVFCFAPDSAKIKNKPDGVLHFFEQWQQLDLPGTFFQVMDMSPSGTHAAIQRPLGYGNDLATQFDEPNAEIAIITSATIQIVRKRRLVDVFAAILRYGSTDDEGREGEVKRFVRNYGRIETAAAALAVACGQAMDVGSDSRLTSVTDPEVVEGARKAFIEQGGKPEVNANAVPDSTASQVDLVKPSSRHAGIVMYVSRLVRSIWRVKIVKEDAAPGQATTLSSTIALDKLRSIQREMNKLQEFLDSNRSFIQGLNDHQPLGRNASRQDEIANQGEHRAMHSTKELISQIIEGISFVIVLFDNNVNDILGALGEESRQRAKELTFEWLFVSSAGRELAKELVKAIVNRNIASGSNVDTVAEQLRRRCGSFCSADDVIIFKAQEQVKRASEAGGQSETGRVLLNESQKLFQRVAQSLSMEHLQWAVQQYVDMVFYAGAVELCLVVANEKDRARRALGWLKDGMVDNDPRKEAFDARKSCYDLVFATIQALDDQTSRSPEKMDGQFTVAVRRRYEAYDVVNSSEDAVFQTCLYDWYISIGQADRLLDIDSRYVVDYLKRRSQEDRAHADMLWRYHAHHNDYLQAASVQLDLAKGFFDLTLEERIEYLSRARTNASTRQTALMDSRQSRQQLLREVSDLLDVANIQSDILERMKAEPRLTGQRREEVLGSLDGQILPIGDLFNQYADQASYHDICIQIYQVADHRNPADIKASWQALIDQTDEESIAIYGKNTNPWELVGEKVRELGKKLNGADSVFPIQLLVPMLEKYAIKPHMTKPPPNWALDLFLDLEVPHETLLPILEGLYYANEHPFIGSKRRFIANQMIYLLQSWFRESERRGERVVLGSEENASLALDCASTLLRTQELDDGSRRDAEWLVEAVQRSLR